MAKKKIAVLFGGVSSEHEVSLKTAVSIINNLNKELYDVIPIGITKSGHWLYYPGSIGRIKDGTFADDLDCCPAVISPDSTHGGIVKLELNGNYSRLKVDCVFAALHGKNGEDGTIAGLCELANIAYVGCNLNGSSNCMDKVICHTILDGYGIKGTDWICINKSQFGDILDIADNIIEKLSLPIYVKPANTGSSVGITKAINKEELIKGIKSAFTHDRKVICEREILGKEIECAVLGNENPKASILGQIIPTNDFYDYDAKYNAPSQLVIPAPIDTDTTNKIREIAIKAYSAMGCEGLSRVDFLISENNEIYLNEINTMPGFTEISMYPKLWDKTGLTYSELLDNLIELAIKRHNDNA